MDEHPPLPSMSRGQTPLKAFVNARWGRRFYEFNPHRTEQTRTRTLTRTHLLTHSRKTVFQVSEAPLCAAADSTLCCKAACNAAGGRRF